ncbi:MAG: AsnC family transcriptional regulator [Brevibacterium sp.]
MVDLSVDALDLDITDALQVDPRVPWPVIGELVERSGVSVSRRWRRLTANGLAWTGIALHPAASQGAFIEMECWSEKFDDVVVALSEHPDVITVGSMTGDFNLYCIVIGVTLDGVLARVDRGLPELKLCGRVRINLFHQIAGGVDWRQGIIDLETWRSRGGSRSVALKEFQRTRNSTGESAFAPSTRYRQLFLTLSADARRPLTEVAEILETSAPVVSRMLGKLIDERQVVFRCDIARPIFDFPIAMVLSLKVAPEHADELAFRIGAWEETRFCASVASTANLIVVAGLRGLVDGESFMVKTAGLGHQVEVIQRLVSTRTFKVYGRLLDEVGRSVRHIPVDPWLTTYGPDLTT